MGSIRLKAVEKWFGKVQVIKGVDLEIDDGEFVVFVGPSGCGKSTLLRMIGGLEDISRGTLEINGKDVSDKPPFERGLSMVFQSYALYPHMTVRENMGFSLKTMGVDKAEIVEKVDQAAQTLKLSAFLDRKPKELSGGQRQRVAIGRSIVRQPTAFLFDEPLSNLDAALRVEMRHEISTLHQSLKTTMIYVTHDQVEAMTLADRIVVLNGGLIVQVGTPKELYNKPANTFVAQFIGSPKMNVIPCEIKNNTYDLAHGGGGNYPFPGKVATHLGIRPEHISLREVGSGTCDGIAMVVEYLGADTFILFDCGKIEQVLVRLAGEAELGVGDKAGLFFNDKQTHFFDANGNAINKT